MAFFKIILALCASALYVQACPGASRAGCGCGLAGAGLGYNGLAGAGLGYNGFGGCGGVASTGGGLPVSSVSCAVPVGISVFSENAYEGPLTVGGNLPFLGTVGLEGVVPTAGTGDVNYGCGDGAVGIATEGPIATGIITPETYGPGVSAFNAYGSGLAGYGAGFGAYGAGINGYGAGINGFGGGLAGRAGYGLGAGIGAGCGCGCGAY